MADKRKALAHRFSLFPSDVDGLIAALELTNDVKEKDKLIQIASPVATAQLKFQLHLLSEAATGQPEKFSEVFTNRLLNKGSF